LRLIRPEPTGFRPEPAGFRPEPAGFRPELLVFDLNQSGFRPEPAAFRPEPAGHRLGKDGTIIVVPVCQGRKGLHRLHYEENDFDNEGVAYRAPCPSILPNFNSKILDIRCMVQLDLSNDQLGKNEAVILSLSLTSMLGLRVLALDGNSIKAKGPDCLAVALTHCHCSEELNLPQNNLDENGALTSPELIMPIPQAVTAHVSAAVKRFPILLKNAHSGSCRFLDNRFDICWALVARKMQRHNRKCSSLIPIAGASDELRVAVAWYCRDFASELYATENHDLQHVAEIVKGSMSIIRVRLQNIRWNTRNLNTLGFMLAHFPPLEELVVESVARSNGFSYYHVEQEKKFGTAGLKLLFLQVGKLRYLKKLVLGATEIGCSGATAFAPLLSHMRHLQLLDLRFCGIGDEGVQALVPALQMITPLAVADFSGNSIGNKGLIILISALQMLPQLKELNLGHIAILRVKE
jgi:hypothetical protein